MKTPLKDAKPEVEFTPNSVYNSAGTVTLTMTAEMAAYMLGQVANATPSAVDLTNGEKLDLYNAIYKGLDRALQDQIDNIPTLAECKVAGARTVKG